MKEGAAYFTGVHNHESFHSPSTQKVTTFQRQVEVCLEEPAYDNLFERSSEEHKFINIHVKSRSFLYHQVRLIVGALVEVGLGRLPPNAIKLLLDQPQPQIKFKMAPAHGLYLMNVNYNLSDTIDPDTQVSTQPSYLTGQLPFEFNKIETQNDKANPSQHPSVFLANHILDEVGAAITFQSIRQFDGRDKVSCTITPIDEKHKEFRFEGWYRTRLNSLPLWACEQIVDECLLAYFKEQRHSSESE
eukprot:m.6088 g.6088  ORF g.6088 m.6088 type:complete len:245 (+) comp5845_c0_seq1:550-1284(+)